jgi:small subunit ribosomal protein S1
VRPGFVVSGDIDRTGETRHLTEDQQGGTTPSPEAIAPENDQAPETRAAVAVADQPADPAEAVAATETPADSTASAEPAASEAAEASAVTSSEEQAPAVETVPATEGVASETGATAEGDTGAGAPSAITEAAAGTTETLSDSETQDAPAAGDDEEPEPAPVRDLGPEPTTMEELLAEQDSDIKSFKHGDVVEGTVVRIDKDEILVDIGAKSEGVVSNRELYGRHAESQPQLAIGDTVLVYVLQPESQEGHAVLSLRRAGLERKWRSMQEQFEAGVIIEAPVIDHNKGGLIVDCGIRGFVPISQIVDFPRRPQNDQPRDAAQEIAEKLMPFVGRKLRLKILEVNRKANRLILSEKVALYEERREKRDELFSSLQVGQKVTGTVRSIAPFGVFIDLGGIDGLVHKSELSWNKVNNPEAGYKVGEEVEAEVIDINHERGRISLSIRRLQPDPWHSTVADFNVGDVIDGTVTKLVNFGAFVRVRDGLEGLIHISELSHQRVAHPGDVVHEGQQLKLKIISLDSERHRLGLSLKQAEEAPARPAPEPGTPAPAGPRQERRPRPERGYSMSDAVQEPEGGIDNTLAAAFAQVRDQLAASEAPTDVEGQAAPSGEAAPAATAETAADAEPETAAVEPSAATADAEDAVEALAADEPAVEASSPTADSAAADAAVDDAVEAVTETGEAAAPEAEAAAPEAEAEAAAPEAEAAAPEAEAPAAEEAAPEAEATDASAAADEAPTENEATPDKESDDKPAG